MKTSQMPTAPGYEKHLRNVDAVIEYLVCVATSGLPSMLDSEIGLFCHRMRMVGSNLVQEGISPRYTVMCVLGMHRLERAGIEAPVALAPLLNRVLSDTTWVDNVGDLGLLLWLCAEVAPNRIATVVERLGVSEALTRYRGGEQRNTMELAWFLTGLCECALAVPSRKDTLKKLASAARDLLLKNQGKADYFSHFANDGGMRRWGRARIGSFADQVYPILALAKHFDAYQDSDSLRPALKCAQSICAAQGSLGQWWWHYDSERGAVAEGYPVFSVHQHAMAPMVLFALGESARTDFSQWIYRGVQWIHENELGHNMVDATAGMIWRSMNRPVWDRCWDGIVHHYSPFLESSRNQNLKVLSECRPYELGWLLYAFAGRSRSDSRSVEGTAELHVSSL